MIQIYILGILAIIIVITLSMYYVESFSQHTNTNKQTHIYICAGDSIINNTNYVKPNMSVAEMLANKIPCYNVAQDNACISDISNQLINIPHKYKKYDNINIILSVGGNDLLEGNDIHIVYKKYMQLLDDIVTNQIKGNGKAYLLNLYYPKDNGFQIFYPIITSWNKKLEQLNKNNIKVIDISSVMNNIHDFTHRIEPSERGGTKIVDTIARSM